ncbi:MAG: hypothetical protein WCW84_10915 [Sulfurimonas sp.]|jgi:uncharacterized protein (TIGR02646 family)
MIKIERNENPKVDHYSSSLVQESLKKDFFKKCYICEEVTRHFEVDHFYPKSHYPHLLNEYKNLFYCCQKCNKIKPKVINTHSDNEILNCCDVDPSEYIKLKLNISECKVEVSQIKMNDTLEHQIKETIALLNRVYNGENSQSTSCEDLKEEIKIKLVEFGQKLDKYQKTKLKNAISEAIREELSLTASYTTFKRWIIRDNLALNETFGNYFEK